MLIFLPFIGYGQNQADSLTAKKLEEVIVSSGKFLKKKQLISQKVDVITLRELTFQNFQNTADALANSGAATVQKSQQGGGSPVIRGFEASRILLLVDGIRMNNLIFRTGHLQNSITVDENILESINIFHGASSSLFGTDALGGAINLSTKKTIFNTNWSGNTQLRYSTANQEKAVFVELKRGTANFASLSTIALNDFGDLRMGKNQNGKNPYFGERYFYVETINGQDVLVKNTNKYLQKFSGYKQIDLMQKFSFRAKQGNLHELNFQFSTSTNIPRYDRLTEPNKDSLKHAQWFYGPQKRLLAVYSFKKDNALFNSDLSLDISYQNVEESRHNRRFNNYNLQNRTESVNVYGINAVLNRKFSNAELIYGIENYLDNLRSTAYSNNINTGAIIQIDTRYPNGKNYMLKNDIFFFYNQVLNKKTNWNLGARFGTATLKSTIADNSIFKLPFDAIRQNNFTYSAATGISYKPIKKVSLTANLSSGFRVPNIDDLAKIFESAAGNLIVPNQNLKPEQTITGDMGFAIHSNDKKNTLEFTFFYTKLFDAIVTNAFTFNNANTILYNGTVSQVFANQNKTKAFIGGVSTTIKAYVFDDLVFSANFNYTKGRILEDAGEKPLDHIAPAYGKIALRYSLKKIDLEAYMLYNGKKDIKDYLLNGEDNEQFAPASGMPAWQTYNIKTAINIMPKAILYIGAENILDTQYRTFSSGINAPGRNFYSALKYLF